MEGDVYPADGFPLLDFDGGPAAPALLASFATRAVPPCGQVGLELKTSSHAAAARGIEIRKGTRPVLIEFPFSKTEAAGWCSAVELRLPGFERVEATFSCGPSGGCGALPFLPGAARRLAARLRTHVFGRNGRTRGFLHLIFEEGAVGRAERMKVRAGLSGGGAYQPLSILASRSLLAEDAEGFRRLAAPWLFGFRRAVFAASTDLATSRHERLEDLAWLEGSFEEAARSGAAR